MEVDFVEFVVFQACCCCGSDTDLCCTSCEKWFCALHMKDCVQCQQPVCEQQCYIDDLCCLVRPWGEKTERHLRDFYENKLVNGKEMYALNYNVRYGRNYIMQAF